MAPKAMTTQEWLEYTEREIARMEWLMGARDFGKTLLSREKELEQATRARDAAYAERDKALAEITAKQDKYEREVKAALGDLARVTREKADAAKKAQADAQAKLDAIHAQIDKAGEVLALSEAQRDAYREDADREAKQITATLVTLRSEERAVRERLGSLLAGIKG